MLSFTRTHALASFCGLAVAIGVVMTCCSPKSNVASKIFRMGEQVRVGSVVYTVYETEWKPQLGDGPSAKIPTNRFLILRLSVTNGGAQNFDIPQLALLDGTGKAYPELTDAPGVTKWLGIIRSVQPAQTEDGRVVFDVPTGSYRLKVSNDPNPASETAALIEIPLDFQPVPSSETPR